jgi:hypothetical protein
MLSTHQNGIQIALFGDVSCTHSLNPQYKTKLIIRKKQVLNETTKQQTSTACVMEQKSIRARRTNGCVEGSRVSLINCVTPNCDKWRKSPGDSRRMIGALMST